MAMKFNTKYSDKCHATPFHFQKPSKTHKELGFECNINNIVLGYTNLSFQKNFSDLLKGVSVSPDDYQNAVYQLAQAKSAFETLPSSLRNKFHNDPKEMLEFISDEKNTDECIKLGIKEKITKPVIDVNVVTPQDVTEATSEKSI